MNAITSVTEPVVGLNLPAEVDMALDDVSTPALIIDLDAFERNVGRMGNFIKEKGIRHRAHAKTHKSADIALYQIEHGGACGVCCQKVAEAEALVTGGVKDVLVSNQVVNPKKIDRLAQMAKNARVLVCVDDLGNVDDLSIAAVNHDTTIECLVEIDCGAGRCGVEWGKPVVEIAKKIATSDGLEFSGLQAYQGAAQHVHDFEERKAKIESAIKQVAGTIKMLTAENLACDIVGGAGTGTYYFEGSSGVYNEMQCGSYIFMDADYQRVKDDRGKRHLRFREQPLHLDLGDVPHKDRQGDLRCRAEGAKRRQRLTGDLRPRRCGVHQVLGRTRRDHRPGKRTEAQRQAEAHPRSLRSDL